jgi:hypothetical protein
MLFEMLQAVIEDLFDAEHVAAKDVLRSVVRDC